MLLQCAGLVTEPRSSFFPDRGSATFNPSRGAQRSSRPPRRSTGAFVWRFAVRLSAVLADAYLSNALDVVGMLGTMNILFWRITSSA